MKKLIVTLFFGVLSLFAFSQNVAINSTGAAPNSSAMLDVSSANTGMLIPRVALSATNNAAPVTAPATSLLVYNTATAGAGATAVTPGYYFWNGSIWVRVLDASSGDDWHITGNTGTTAGTNFIGTSDNVSLDIRTNNTNRIRVLNTGNVGIGTTTPSQLLHVQGNSLVTGNSYIYSATNGELHYGTAGLFGQATTFAPNSGNSGLWIEGSNDGESGGIFMNGNTMCLWSPGDADILRVYDEDNFAGGAKMVLSGAGYLGIGATAPGYLLTVAGTGTMFGIDNTATFAARNSGGTYESYFWPRWSDNVMYMNYGSSGFHIRNNSSATTMFMTNGNYVGIGTTSPGYQLELTGSFGFGNVSGVYRSRTETRNDAGLQGNAGAQSGFFETSAPAPAADWPVGAASWWHLIDCRHSNSTNNYALQIAGSFFDQKLYFRKTAGSATTAWKELVTWDQLILNTYGTNNQGVSGTTDITINSTAFTDMPQMTITFTPVHSVVYVNFTFSAYANPTYYPMMYCDFRILRDGVNIGGSNCLVEDYDDVDGIVTSFNGSLNLRVPVTAGVSTTIKVQWRRDGLYTGPVYCNPATAPDYCHRSLIIID